MDDDQEIATAASELHLDGDLLKKLVLAIIKANPASNKTDNQRANAAMKALLGSGHVAKKSTPGVAEALRWIAEEYVADRGGPSISPGKNPFAWLERDCPTARGAKELAELATEKFSHATTPRNLENLFSRYGAGICKAVAMNSDIPGSLHNQALRQIRDILTPLGVAMKLDDAS